MIRRQGFPCLFKIALVFGGHGEHGNHTAQVVPFGLQMEEYRIRLVAKIADGLFKPGPVVTKGVEVDGAPVN